MEDARALADSLSPYLIAVARPFSSRQHAPFYGWALALPYVVSVQIAANLRQAFMVLLAFHALIAPVAFLCIRRLRPSSLGAALLVGAVIALDRGLQDTALSGAEGYLAGLWIGLMAYSVISSKETSSSYGWPFGAMGAFAVAVMNHPLALCSAPLLGLLPWRERRTYAAALCALLLMMPGIHSMLSAPLTTSGGAPGDLVVACRTFVREGFPSVILVILAPLVGLSARRTRGLALSVLVSAGLLLLLGSSLDYLREHHLRLLSVPAILCLAAVPPRWLLAAVPFILVPTFHSRSPEEAPRPGSLAMATAFAGQLEAETTAEGWVVDQMVLSGPPCAEPSAIMLELRLRHPSGHPLEPRGRVALVVSAGKEGSAVGSPAQAALMALLTSDGVNDRTPAFASTSSGEGGLPVCLLLVGGAESFLEATAKVCRLQPSERSRLRIRLGGAWDGLAPLRPETRLEELDRWFSPCLLAPEPEGGEEGPTPPLKAPRAEPPTRPLHLPG